MKLTKNSPIFSGHEKPVHVGWYCASHWDYDRLAELQKDNDLHIIKHYRHWWYWDGRYWLSFDLDMGTSFISVNQDKAWFGRIE